MDIQNCPLLLGDLNLLRKSICFKSLFVPGVCCPDAGVQIVALDDNLNIVNEVQEVLPQGTTAAPPAGAGEPAGVLPQGTTRRPPLPPPSATQRPGGGGSNNVGILTPTSRPVVAGDTAGASRPNRVPGTNLGKEGRKA